MSVQCIRNTSISLWRASYNCEEGLSKRLRFAILPFPRKGECTRKTREEQGKHRQKAPKETGIREPSRFGESEGNPEGNRDLHCPLTCSSGCVESLRSLLFFLGLFFCLSLLYREYIVGFPNEESFASLPAANLFTGKKEGIKK